MFGTAFEDKKTVFFFAFSFVLTLLMLGLMSMSYAYVDVLCHTLDFIPWCSPLFSVNLCLRCSVNQAKGRMCVQQ